MIQSKPRRSPLTLIIALIFCAAVPGFADQVSFEGLNRITEAKAKVLIAEQVRQIETSGATRPRADDAAYFLEQALYKRGFRESEVLWKIGDGGKRVILTVNEGRPAMLGTIEFTGVEVGNLKALKESFTAATKQHSSSLFEGELPYVEEELKSGLENVERYYVARGFWGAKVGPLVVDEQPDQEKGIIVNVRVRIEEGPVYRFAEFKFDDSELETLTADLVGQPTTTENVAEARSRVTSHFTERGFFRSRVAMTANQDSENVVVEFEVTTGQQFTVAGIEIEGVDRLNPDFIRKRYADLEGAPFDPERSNAITRELIGQGLFRSLRVQPDERDDGTVGLLIQVEEARSKEIGVYGGYGTFDGPIIGLSLRERNLFGTGRSGSLEGELTERGIQGAIRYSDHWLFDTPWRFNARFLALEKQLEGYEKSEFGPGVGISRALSDRYTISFDISSTSVDILNSNFTPDELGDPSYVVNKLGFSQIFDTRDDPNLPRRGLIAENRIEYGFSSGSGDDIEFVRASLRATAHIPIGERSVLSLGARTGMLFGSGDRDLPIDLRFFNGGASSVRSFPELQMPPLGQSGDPLGGEVYNTFNAEFTTPIRGSLRAAIFADAGNLLRSSGDSGLSGMHYAAGVGLRYDLPTGPIRLDYGWNLNQSEGEPSGAVHLTVGISF
ncbi:MAG: outer membrane protein insertion porin family [Verrucomicrobiales bacterium]|jgi:outer membrane protein insertion porin family